MTQEQYSDLHTYIPASDMVKMVFLDMHPELAVDDWSVEISKLADNALSGDTDALFNMMELIYLNARNEGQLEVALDE